MEATCILAFGCGRPDREFASLEALARAIVAERDKLAEGRWLVGVSANLARGADLPAGACVSVRALDGSNGGKGALIGYAFLPRGYAGVVGPSRLMAAIRAAVAERVAA